MREQPPRRRRRRWLDSALLPVTGFCMLLTLGLLVGVVAAIVARGSSAVTWHFLTEQIRVVGAEGGIFYNLVGTLILVGAAAVVSTPLALAIALMHGVYITSARTKRFVMVCIYTLNGVPSILFGIVGMVVFLQWLQWGKSWLTGGVLLGMMILPTVCVALIERIAVVPRKYVEAAMALGLRRSQVVRSVILPHSVGGLFTGLLLGLARAAGETAPIMFTATIFAGATFPHGIRESPVLSLPYHIFILAQDSLAPGVEGKVWGSATVLLVLVVVLSAIALPMRLRAHEEARHG